MADDNPRQEEQLDALIKLLGGDRNSPFTNSTATPRGGNKRTRAAAAKDLLEFSTSLQGASKAFKTMHAGVDDFAHELKYAVRGFIGFEILVDLFKGALNLTKTFNKLSDIGQNFGGNMFAMAEQAGRAGLSLNEWSDYLSRNSVTSALMNKDTSASFYSLQATADRASAALGHTGGSAETMTRQQAAAGTALATAKGHVDAMGESARSTGQHHAEAGTAATGVSQDFGAVSTAATEMVRRQAETGIALTQTGDMIKALGVIASATGSRHADTGDAVSALMHNLDALGQDTIATSAATLEFKKQIAAATSTGIALSVSQGVVEGQAARLGDRLAATGRIASDVAEKQTASSNLTAQFSAQMGVASETVAKMAAEQGVASDVALRLSNQFSAAAATTGAMIAQQSDLQTATTQFGKDISEASSSVTAMVGQQGNVGDTAMQLSKQLGLATTSVETIGTKQAAMSSLVTQLNRQFGDAATGGAEIVAKQAVSGNLTALYDKQMADARVTLADMTARQTGAADTTTHLTRQLKAVSDASSDLAKSQTESGQFTDTFNRQINDAAATAAKMAKVTQPELPPTNRINTGFAHVAVTATTVGEANTLMQETLTKSNEKLNILTDSIDSQSQASVLSARQSTENLRKTADAALAITADTDARNQGRTATQAETAVRRKNTDVLITTTKTQGSHMADVQMLVRNGLEKVGFYGMALSEVTNATSDYMDVLRETGRLTKMGDQERADAVTTMLGQTSALSTMFGKSRQEIMKATNDALKQINLSSRLSIEGNENLSESATSLVNFIAAMPGELGKLAPDLAEAIGQQKDFVMTEKGSSLLQGGDMGQGVVELINQYQQRAESGIKMTKEDQIEFMAKLHALDTKANIDNANMLAVNESQRPHANLALGVVGATRGVGNDKNGQFSRLELAKQMHESEKQTKMTHDMTMRFELFHSNFNKMTGSFVDGFYDGLLRMMGGGNNREEFKRTMDRMQAMFKNIGEVIGSFLGHVFSEKNIRTISNAFDKMIPALQALGDALGWVYDQFERVSDDITTMLKKFHVGGGWAELIGIAAPILMIWFVKNYLRARIGRFIALFMGEEVAAMGLGGALKGRAAAGVAAEGGILSGVLGGLLSNFKILGLGSLSLTSKFGVATRLLGKTIGVMGSLALRAFMAHEFLTSLDPNDSMGAWIDKHIPGASFLDDLASKIGLGRSKEEQKRVQKHFDAGDSGTAEEDDAAAADADADTMPVGPDGIATMKVHGGKKKVSLTEMNTASDALAALQDQQDDLAESILEDQYTNNPNKQAVDQAQMIELTKRVAHSLETLTRLQKEANDQVDTPSVTDPAY